MGYPWYIERAPLLLLAAIFISGLMLARQGTKLRKEADGLRIRAEELAELAIDG